MRDELSEYWKEAITKEWAGILSNNTLEFVKRRTIPSGANVMNCHFVFDCKPRPDGSVEKFKARLVADGNTQKQGVDFDAVFATVVKLPTVRVALALAAQFRWGLWQWDIQQAFLQATLTDELYMRLPPHLPARDADGDLLVCKLHKSLYGLRQAAREWAERLNACLLDFGFRRCAIDTCVYRYDAKDGGVLILLVYVDDLVGLYSHDALRDRFSAHLCANLPVDDRGALAWFLRMHVQRDGTDGTVVLSQQNYVDGVIRRFCPDAADGRAVDTPLDEAVCLCDIPGPLPDSAEYADMAPKRATYMSAVGALLWLAGGTRPDLTFAVSVLARFCSNPAPAHYAALERVLRYLARTRDRSLRFLSSRSGLVVYSDASWATKNSTSGGVILYNNCPISWWSRRQKSVSASTCEAECYAAALASREALFIRDLLDDLGYPVAHPTPLCLDSKSALDLAADPVAFKKTKHIMRHAYELRDRVQRRFFAPCYVSTGEQLADILTKGLRADAHVRFMDKILVSGLSSAPEAPAVT